MGLNFCKIQVTKNIEEANCITHSGTFHADEIFATVFLSLLLPEIKVARVSEVTKKMENAIVYDVGLSEFDHHQAGGNGKRENGLMYASCGLIWKAYGKDILKKSGVKGKDIDYILAQIDKNLIQFIDANDNGITPYIDAKYKFVTIASIISKFNPRWNEKVDPDIKFMEAIDIARIVVRNTLESEIAKLEAKSKVEEAIKKSKNNIMILDEYMPWKELITESEIPKAKEILFVVFPSNRGGYNVYTVPKDAGNFENRKDLPKEWSGLRGKALQEVTGVKTAGFCHTACFICTAETEEDAIKLATLANEY